MADLTHASWFSGVGGLDMGLEAAGWTTTSFSEIDPYASAVLAHHWPHVPNLGSIVDVAADARREPAPVRSGRASRALVGGRNGGHAGQGADASGPDWRTATLWTGGFPCQDLSVAGKRKGFTGERSVLAFTFLELVERFRPPLFLLENVPGLLSSHGGRDMAALLGAICELGYGVSWRTLNAANFGVPQRRRRVFILAVRCGADDSDGRLAAERGAEVLSVGTRCERHPAAGGKKRTTASDGSDDGADESGIVGTITRSIANGPDFGIQDEAIVTETVGALNNLGHHGWTANAQSVAQGHVIPVGPSPDAAGVRAADGLAGRAHNRAGVEVSGIAENQRGEVRLTHGVSSQPTTGGDPLNPDGLDSHRYRCAGNGVVSPVAEWIGHRLAALAAQMSEEADRAEDGAHQSSDRQCGMGSRSPD